MPGYILSVDQSTAGTKGVILDKTGKIIARSDIPHQQISTPQGYVEHDSTEIWENTKAVIKQVVEKSGVGRESIVQLAISNQRETVAFWDKTTGKPLHNAIVWQCSRGQGIADELEQTGYADKIKQITGLNLSPYFSAAKIAWVLRNTRGIDINNLAAGTIDSWLIYKLTGGKVFATDYSNASRTQLLDLVSLGWSDEVASYFKIPTSILPTPRPSDHQFGETDLEGYFPQPIKICGVVGDSHGALFGQGCISPGMTKATYGTGSSVMTNIGSKPITSSPNVVSSIAWGREGSVDYVLEGNINYTGAVIKWLVEDLQLIHSPKEAGVLAKAANPEDKSYIVPGFSGLSAPYWEPNATAVITGMTRITKKAEIVKAAEESIGYQINDVLGCIKEAGGLQLTSLRVDGGPTRDNYLMQFQADISDINLQVPAVEELSAIGAAFIGGIKTNFYTIDILDSISRTSYNPTMDYNTRSKKVSGWNKALSMALAGAK